MESLVRVVSRGPEPTLMGEDGGSLANEQHGTDRFPLRDTRNREGKMAVPRYEACLLSLLQLGADGDPHYTRDA